MAIKNSDVIITDKVVSMNDRVNKKKSHFEKFKINKQLIKLAKNNAIFLHCLPSDEVSEDVFLGKTLKCGHRLQIEFMFRNQYYFIV